MTRLVQTLNLVDDAKLIDFYTKAHQNVWPEVTEGIKSVGITAMDIYRKDTLLVMILEFADGVDRDEAMRKLASLPRQAEWEDYVGKAQVCQPGSNSGEKWSVMQQIFKL